MRKNTNKKYSTLGSDIPLRVLKVPNCKALPEHMISGMPKIIRHMISRCVHICWGLNLICNPVQDLYPCDIYTNNFLKSNHKNSRFGPDADLSHGRTDDGRTYKHGKSSMVSTYFPIELWNGCDELWQTPLIFVPRVLKQPLMIAAVVLFLKLWREYGWHDGIMMDGLHHSRYAFW